jgi:hypothetical protein
MARSRALRVGLGLLGLRFAVVLRVHQLLLEVLFAAKVREEQLVLRAQRHASAKDAKGKFVGRLDEAVAASSAPGHRDDSEDMGRRHRFIQLDDMRHLPALSDLDSDPSRRGSTSSCVHKAWHSWDLEALHRLVLVASDVPDDLVLLHWVDARRPRHVDPPDASI